MYLSTFVVTTFLATVFLTLYLGYRAINKDQISARNLFLVESAVVVWLLFHHFLARADFYKVFNVLPPRILLVFFPLILLMVFLLTIRRDQTVRLFSLQGMMWLHIVRIPVELVLWRLALEGFIPEVMSFEGRNFDILAGITAPLIVYLVFYKKTLGKTGLLVWNVICLGLLINIISLAIMSAPGPLQQMAFQQPNIGIAFTPMILLPAFVAPLVLFFHLVSIVKLLTGKADHELR
ncbi:MAG: hypothetical protein ACRBF0_19225 [Calditrichia bacterium]